MMRTIFAYVIAAAIAFAAASFAHTQMILNDLAAMGAPVTAGLRLSQTVSDMLGLIASGAQPAVFPAIIAAGLLVAFIVAGFVARLAPNVRWLVFMVAGAVAMFVIFAALKATLGTVGLFGARGALGLALQMAAGALGGVVFSILKPRAE